LVWRAVGKNNARFIAGYPRTALPQSITTEGEIAKDASMQNGESGRMTYAKPLCSENRHIIASQRNDATGQ
jgi:hypothetical protein